MFLTHDELEELTGKQRGYAQVRVLRLMGINHRVRADGSVAVLKSHVEKIFDGKEQIPVMVNIEPNWNAAV